VPRGNEEGPGRTADAEVGDLRRLERELRGALARDGFLLHYQPLVKLSDASRFGMEALIRWPNRRRGMIAPSLFIPVAEANGAITPIGGWVLRTACRDAALWPDGGVVSVNVSARQFAGGVLIGQVARALLDSGLPPERLQIEITETMLLDVDTDVLFMLAALFDRGVSIALDDFATGYASLAMLRRLPLNMLKLDRSLIRGLPHNAEDAAILRAVLDICRVLRISVLAEGIERAEQRDFLREHGCDYGQGYLFSRPLPAAAWTVAAMESA